MRKNHQPLLPPRPDRVVDRDHRQTLRGPQIAAHAHQPESRMMTLVKALHIKQGPAQPPFHQTAKTTFQAEDTDLAVQTESRATATVMMHLAAIPLKRIPAKCQNCLPQLQGPFLTIQNRLQGSPEDSRQDVRGPSQTVAVWFHSTRSTTTVLMNLRISEVEGSHSRPKTVGKLALSPNDTPFSRIRAPDTFLTVDPI